MLRWVEDHITSRKQADIFFSVFEILFLLLLQRIPGCFHEKMNITTYVIVFFVFFKKFDLFAQSVISFLLRQQIIFLLSKLYYFSCIHMYQMKKL